jgi:hypothetical protein
MAGRWNKWHKEYCTQDCVDWIKKRVLLSLCHRRDFIVSNGDSVPFSDKKAQPNKCPEVLFVIEHTIVCIKT